MQNEPVPPPPRKQQWLSMGLQKREFMGTGAWYYLIGNCVKVPFSLALGLISGRSRLFNLETAPLILAGAAVGILTFRFIPQRWFNRAILLLAALAALRLLLARADDALTLRRNPAILWGRGG